MHERSSSRGRRMSVGTGTVALSLGLCLCAGQLVATPAASAAPVTTAAAVKTVKPKQSVSYNKRTVLWGSKVRVTTKLTDPRTGKKVVKGYVRLQSKINGKWKTWQKKPVRSGAVVFNTKPGRTVWFRTYYGGSSGLAPAATKSVKITVKASGAKILAEAKRHKGALYKFGAAGPKRFDCSGYTQYVYKKAAGKKLPHKANSQQHYGKKVGKGSKKAGDLLVFRSGSYGTHVGIYAGGGYMWAAPHTGARVKKQKVYSSNYVVRRIV
ncbi:NlpC/P60 family protein [Actinoplanes sp. NPDC049548]|uniref:C40 family peptidase n=1 Tax=Actinoplanes sp. NPDC049548 TaxID=3155152 RepID=UPI00343396ED